MRSWRLPEILGHSTIKTTELYAFTNEEAKRRDSQELSDRAKPPTAHISRAVIEEDGEELEIVRHSFPYETTSESGLFFIAYAKDLSIPHKMLSRMMGTSGDSFHDRLMDFSRAVSGANFFAPSLKVLRSLGSR